MLSSLFINEDTARSRLYGRKGQGPSLWGALGHEARYFWDKKAVPDGKGLGAVVGSKLGGFTFGRKRKDVLPAGFPADLFEVVNNLLLKRGGLFDKETATPNFWAVKGDCYATELTWSIGVQYADNVDPHKLHSFEMALEDRLTRAGYDVNVRILARPLRIEIDKPTPPTVTLTDYWQQIADLPQNQRLCAFGVAVAPGGLALRKMALINDQFSLLIAGSPGSGKTQLALGLILSLCMANSPDRVSLVICDPKAVDWMPLGGLPHLAAPIATEPEECLALIDAMVGEMDSRTKRAKAGDRSFLQHTIALYIDELADLLVSLPNADKERLIVNLQRLSQKGRGVGFIIIAATQRVYDLDARAYSKLNVPIVGKTRNANDSAAATGIPGTQTHKLPGKGAFEIYPAGERVQGFYVADADKANYARQLGVYVANIRQRWLNAQPCWRPSTVAEINTPTEAAQPSQLEALALRYGADFVGDLVAMYRADTASLTGQAIRKRYKELTEKSMNNDTASKIMDTITGSVSTKVAA